jgi:hypothetical protein
MLIPKHTLRKCITLSFKCELRQMLSINQHFGKTYSCHFQGECVLGQVLEALYRAGSEW